MNIHITVTCTKKAKKSKPVTINLTHEKLEKLKKLKIEHDEKLKKYGMIKG